MFQTRGKGKREEEFACCFGEPVSRLVWMYLSVCVWVADGSALVVNVTGFTP